MTSLTEVDKFKALLFSIYENERAVVVRTNGITEAKKLRARFYRLRDALPIHERHVADGVQFTLANHRILCSRKRIAPADAWTESVTFGAEDNASGNSKPGEPTPSS